MWPRGDCREALVCPRPLTPLSQYDVKGDASNRRMSDFDVGAGKQHSPVAQKSKPLRRNVSWEERMGEAASALGPAMADAAEGKALSWREFAALSAKMLISNPGGTHDEVSLL